MWDGGEKSTGALGVCFQENSVTFSEPLSQPADFVQISCDVPLLPDLGISVSATSSAGQSRIGFCLWFEFQVDIRPQERHK